MVALTRVRKELRQRKRQPQPLPPAHNTDISTAESYSARHSFKKNSKKKPAQGRQGKRREWQPAHQLIQSRGLHMRPK